MRNNSKDSRKDSRRCIQVDRDRDKGREWEGAWCRPPPAVLPLQWRISLEREPGATV
jgi:hypothetical protein